MNIQATSREDYFQKAEDREGQLRKLDELIRETTPSLEPVLFQSKMFTGLGYGLRPYQTKAMKEPEDWPLVALALQKNYISLYVSAVIDGQYMAELYAPELGKVSCGKSCIRFKRFDDVDETGLRRLLEDLEERVASGEKVFSF